MLHVSVVTRAADEKGLYWVQSRWLSFSCMMLAIGIELLNVNFISER